VEKKTKKGKGKELAVETDTNPIFIVDDTMLNIKVMKAMLSQLGVSNAKDFSDGFSFISHLLLWSRKLSFSGALADCRRCLCFIDKEMPFLSGVGVVNLVRFMEADLNVSVTFVGVTAGHWDDESLDDMIPKPLKIKVVERVLHKFLQNGKSLFLSSRPTIS
jgi:hypothetical protein